MRVTAVGDCGVDRYLSLGRDRPGGITLNFAANARRLFPAGDTVGVVTPVGTDREARLVRRAIAELGLEACLAERHGRGGHRRALPRRLSSRVLRAEDFLREYCASRDAARSLARGAEEAAASVQRGGAFPWDD